MSAWARKRPLSSFRGTLSSWQTARGAFRHILRKSSSVPATSGGTPSAGHAAFRVEPCAVETGVQQNQRRTYMQGGLLRFIKGERLSRRVRVDQLRAFRR